MRKKVCHNGNQISEHGGIVRPVWKRVLFHYFSAFIILLHLLWGLINEFRNRFWDRQTVILPPPQSCKPQAESWTAFYLRKQKLIRFRSTRRIRRVSGGGTPKFSKGHLLPAWIQEIFVCSEQAGNVLYFHRARISRKGIDCTIFTSHFA